MTETLEERVQAFRSLSLPGQPMMMHVGTGNLVEDLWRLVCDLKTRIEEQSVIVDNGYLNCVLCGAWGHLADGLPHKKGCVVEVFKRELSAGGGA